jgi:hypothetical protein
MQEDSMILVRNVFRAKFGKGGDLAQQMVAGMNGTTGGGRWRVLTDLSSGPFDTVVFEGELPSLAEWEAFRGRMLSDPAMREAMSGTQELIQSGYAELYTIEAQGGP